MSMLFWIFVLAVAYVYFGYPLLLLSNLLGRRRPICRRETLLSVSIIVPAREEESVIGEKIKNLLALDYPRERLEILVGNDGSTDRTEEVVREYTGHGVRLLSGPQPRGKSSMQNDLVESSSAPILVFTDADCLLPPDAVRLIVEAFADQQVGLVVARPSYLNERATEITKNECLYLRYESWLRREESSRGLLAMASGSLFAMRRVLWEPLDPDVGDDFVLPLRTALRGYRNVLLPEALVATRLAQDHVDSMLRMKIRIISKDLRGLLQNWHALNPLTVGAVAVGLWSHKLLRWLVPYFLLGIIATNAFLVTRKPFGMFMILQAVFYGIALTGIVLEKMRIRFPLSVAASFCLVNVAALLGTLQCAFGRTRGQWTTMRNSVGQYRVSND